MSRAEEDPAVAEAKEFQKKLDRQFQESLGWYQLTVSPGSGAALKPKPVLRWTNATRKQKGEPTLILWTDAGRPEALASVYPWGTNLLYECVSLARDPGLTAKEGGRTVWSPASAGVTYHDVPDAPPAGETPASRLTQMRSISERFKVSITGAPADREQLRLLPKPIYRYELADAKAARPDPVDGAVFAFVQGTDPEAVLLIEAVRRGDRVGWQYALGRATGYGVEARLGNSVVWSALNMPTWNDMRLPAVVLGRRLAAD